MQFEPRPLSVSCDSCGMTAETWDFQHPDWAVTCGCCPEVHDHTGLGCRPVTVTGTAHLTIFSIEELLELAGGLPLPVKEMIPDGNV